MSVCTPLVSISLVVKLFPQMHKVTVYRWARSEDAENRGRRLPRADVLIDDEKHWRLSTIERWAQDEGLWMDARVVEQICRTQQV